MTRIRWLCASAAFALATAAAVIAGAGYRAGASQVALIAGPTLLPFLVLAPVSAGTRSWIALAAVSAAGWIAAVAAERAHDAPDASFAVFVGWYGVAAATLVGVALLAVHWHRHRHRHRGN